MNYCKEKISLVHNFLYIFQFVFPVRLKCTLFYFSLYRYIYVWCLKQSYSFVLNSISQLTSDWFFLYLWKQKNAFIGQKILSVLVILHIVTHFLVCCLLYFSFFWKKKLSEQQVKKILFFTIIYSIKKANRKKVIVAVWPQNIYLTKYIYFHSVFICCIFLLSLFTKILY